MKKPLNILIAEDSQDDVDILMAELRRAGFAPVYKRVETEADFLAGLKAENLPDIIISDYSMPQFSGLRAAQLTQESGLNIPFILVSGTVGEEIAVEAMKHGATDYLLKDRIARLGSAVEQALDQKRLREERIRVLVSLNLFRALLDQSSDGIEVIDPATGYFLDVNDTTIQRLGYGREELLAMRVPDVDIEGVAHSAWDENVEQIRQMGFKVLEGIQRRKDGTTFPVEVSVRYVKLDREYLIAAVRDITQRKQADKEIKSQLEELKRWHDAMLNREGRILELKGEVNALLRQQNQPPRYSQTATS